MERQDLVLSIYDRFKEDERLVKSAQGKTEFLTTMSYINKHIKRHSKILEVGAGTGRYSIELAKLGHEVSSVELSKTNIDIMKSKIDDNININVFQADATSLSMFDDETFDLVLVLGPMYHLFEEDEIDRAIKEAKRVSKKDGIIMFAFLSIYSIMATNYLQGNFKQGLEFNFDENMKVKHYKEQFFTGYDVNEFEELMKKSKIRKISILGCDSILEIAEGRKDFKLDGEDYDSFLKYHLSTCEKRELLGMHSHLLFIGEKE